MSHESTSQYHYPERRRRLTIHLLPARSQRGSNSWRWSRWRCSHSILNKSTFSKIRLRVPSKTNWADIASILSTYDDLIENNRQRIQLLEQMARLLYREWFVHLRFPGHKHVTITDGVPQGWQRKTIADVCRTVGGGTPSTNVSEYWDGDVTWVIPSDVTKNDCLVLLDSERKITNTGLRASSAKIVPAETILMTSRATVGFFALMDSEVCTNQGFINIIPHGNYSPMLSTARPARAI